MMKERSGKQVRPPAGTFRAKLEITNRSGWVTREYRLLFRPDSIRVVYTNSRVSYTIRREESGDVVCNCPSFDPETGCKHRDAVMTLLEGLEQRLRPRAAEVPGKAAA
jgi:hypothetical protein